jgi:hypothetical protein
MGILSVQGRIEVEVLYEKRDNFILDKFADKSG